MHSAQIPRDESPLGKLITSYLLSHWIGKGRNDGAAHYSATLGTDVAIMSRYLRAAVRRPTPRAPAFNPQFLDQRGVSNKRNPSLQDWGFEESRPARKPKAARDPRDSCLSPSVLALAKKHDIGLPPEVSSIKPQTRRFQIDVKTAKRHTFHPWHMKYIERHGHVLADKYFSKYSKRVEDPLWWQIVNTVDGSKGVVRSKSKKHARHAFKTALLESGYDEFGRRQETEATKDGPGGPGRSNDGQAKPAELYGTVALRIIDARAFLRVDMTGLVAYLKTVVAQHLEPLLGRSKEDALTRWK